MKRVLLVLAVATAGLGVMVGCGRREAELKKAPSAEAVKTVKVAVLLPLTGPQAGIPIATDDAPRACPPPPRSRPSP